MTAASYEARLDRLTAALERLFGPREPHLLQRCLEARADLRDIRDRRGLSGTLITVLGHKNAGKSTLCRLLVYDEAARARIGAGLGSAGATRRILWIGPETPARPEPEHEAVIYVEAQQMAELGEPYLLADIPGYSDSDPAARAAAERILRMASTAVVVLSLEMAEDEAGLAYLRRCDGARLLPVVVADEPERLANAAAVLGPIRARLAAVCPASTVAEPVLLPKLDLLPPEARAQQAAQASAAIANALARLLQQTPASPARLAATRWERFRAGLSEELTGFLQRVGPRYEELTAREEEAAREIARLLQGSPAQFAAGVRLRLLSDAADACPRLYFPFRSFLGLLTLCSGAWDRLILTGLGSLPSLAAVLLQSARNARTLADARSSARSQLESRAAALAAERIAPERRAFLRSIDETLGQERALPVAAPVLEGLEAMESALGARVEAGVRQWRASPGWIAGVGLLATVLWLGLALGPLWSVYHAFINAWQGALQAGGGWEAFPSPSAGMWLTSLLLIFAPVMGLAMVALAGVASRRRVARCLETIDADGLTAQLLEARVVRLRSNDELEAAVRVVLDECGPPP